MTGFTPGKKAISRTIAMMGAEGEDEAREAERAVLRFQGDLVPILVAALAEAKPPLRGRIVRALGKVNDERGRHAVVSALSDDDPRTRKEAARSLGRMGNAEAVLLERLGREDPRARNGIVRAIVEALGKIGGHEAEQVLRRVTYEDATLESERQRALVMLARLGARADTSFLGDKEPAKPLSCVLLCRAGLESITLEELRSVRGVDVTRHESGSVSLRLKSAPRSLFASRTWHTMTFPLPRVGGERQRREGDSMSPSPEDVATALASEEAKNVAATFGPPPHRFRIEWVGAGPKRAASYAAAQRVLQQDIGFINDPRAAPWEARVTGGAVALVPKALVDPRFAYRVADVPAASHPTIAAALVHVAGVRNDDVVWDPFVGSGLELVERARMGPHESLIGTDTDEGALQAARDNLQNAGISAELVRADARTFRKRGITLILTNPPMGRRVNVGAIDALLEPFLVHAAHILDRGGRMVWVSPSPRKTDIWTQGAGFSIDARIRVDMGGFFGEIQRLTVSRVRGASPSG